MFFVSIGLMFLLSGLILFPLPIPFVPGSLFIAIGLGVLITWSVTARRLMRKTRRRSPYLNSWIQFLENQLPERWSSLLRKTAPGRGRIPRVEAPVPVVDEPSDTVR